MALYEYLTEIDVISPVEDQLANLGFILTTDGKIKAWGEFHHYVNTPWINAKCCPDRNCFIWYKIYFRLYRIISRNCFNCWKITTRPPSLKALFELHEWQQEYVKGKDILPCKSGIERRFTGKPRGIYAAFWYCPLGCGVEEAKKWHKKIERKVQKDLGIQWNIGLKRACTEMEDEAGPSNKWIYTNEQRKYEDLLDSVWDIPSSDRVESTVSKVAVQRRWIEHGVQHRDKVANEYYDSLKSFGIQEYEMYHDTKKEIVSDPELGKTEKKEGSHGDSKILRL